MGGETWGGPRARRQGADPAFPRLLGERLCLDFVNSVENPLGAHPEEFLHAYPDLVRWGRHVGFLDDDEVARLLRQGERRPGEAASVFEHALVLRRALDRLFRAIAHGDSPPAADLALVRAEYLAALDHARLAPRDQGFGWEWPLDESALAFPVWAVARSAVALLTEEDPARVKECPGTGDCGWLFYDTSKNGSRRWCSMEGCGSRAKMRALYARRRAGEATDQG